MTDHRWLVGSQRPRISVAMATYNGANYLQEQLESLAAQTLQPDEVVVCDDSSDDATIGILEEFSRRAPFSLRIHRNETRLGYSRNFERAISLCQGDVVFLSDQDDVWFPTKIEVVIEAFRSRSHPLVVVHDAELTDACLSPSGLTFAGQFRSAGLALKVMSKGCCTAFRAEIMPLLLPIPHDSYVHDMWIHQLGFSLGRLEFIADVLEYHRRHGKNTSDWFTSQLRRVTLIDRFIYYWAGNSYEGCERYLRRLEVLLSRLTERGAEIERLLGESLDLENVLNGICREKAAVKRRLELLQLSPLCRLPRAVVMLKDGDYRYFSGVMSWLKDLLRR